MTAPDDGAARADDATDGAQHSEAEKRPLFRSLPPSPAFPIRAMGGLRAAAEAVHGRTQAPLSMCAQSVLAAVTLAAQPHRDVELPGGGRKPLTGLFASVADSGERKTSVDRVALAPVYEVEEELRATATAEVARFAADLAAWKEAAERIKKTGKGDRALIRDGLVNLGPEPKPPPHPMLLVADPTPEALILHLADGRPSAGVFTAEGGLLVGGAAFNEDTRMRTAALFNTLWDGEPIRRQRVLTGRSFLPGRRCSMHVMLQPVVADGLFGDPMLDGIGMLARVLVVAPESTAGTRMFREARDDDRNALAAYRETVAALLRRPPATKPDDAGILDPPVMHLSPAARALWIEFANDTEAAIAPGGRLALIKAFAAKMAEHAGRLAAALTVYDDPDAMEVPAHAMANGIALAQHYGQEMLRLAGAAAINPDLRLAHRLLAWWREQGGRDLHLAAVYQRGPNTLRDAAAARRIMHLLEDHGYAQPLPPGTDVDGAPRKEAWKWAP